MKKLQDGMLLRIYIGEQDKWEGTPLYEAIVLLARKEMMSGATVIKGCMGFGRKSHMHTAKILRLSENLPMVVEMVDTTEKINAFIPHLDRMVKEGLITLESVSVMAYQA